MSTENYNLPKITGNMTADVVRDMNALADATDAAIKTAVDGVDLSTVEQQIADVSDDLAAHSADEANPHRVTKSQIGLGNVDNVKQIPFDFINKPNGVLGLDEDGKAPSSMVRGAMTKVAEIDTSQGTPTGIYNITNLSSYKRLIVKGKKLICEDGTSGMEILFNNLNTANLYTGKKFNDSAVVGGSSLNIFSTTNTQKEYDFLLDIDAGHKSKLTYYYSMSRSSENSLFNATNIGLAGINNSVLPDLMLESIQIKSIKYGGGIPPKILRGNIEVWGEM